MHLTSADIATQETTHTKQQLLARKPPKRMQADICDQQPIFLPLRSSEGLTPASAEGASFISGSFCDVDFLDRGARDVVSLVHSGLNTTESEIPHGTCTVGEPYPRTQLLQIVC